MHRALMLLLLLLLVVVAVLLPMMTRLLTMCLRHQRPQRRVEWWACRHQH